MRFIHIPKKTLTEGMGLFYNGHVLNDQRGIAPAGWHVPTSEEVDTLIQFLGGTDVAGGKMKDTSSKFWNFPNTGATNEVGLKLNAPGQRGLEGAFMGIYCSGNYWTSSVIMSGQGMYQVNNQYQNVISVINLYRNSGLSIRLIKDDSTNPGMMTDSSGNKYPTVKVGTQVWMAANLATIRYSNGDLIGELQDNEAWANATGGAYCAPLNDWSLVREPPLNPINEGFGLLYNCYTLTDERGIAPEGWHVPTLDEWHTLSTRLGGSNVAGGKLKDVSWHYWDNVNEGATNEKWMNFRGTGVRGIDLNLSFTGIYNLCQYWSTTDYNSYKQSIQVGIGNATIEDSYGIWNNGFNIRLIKDDCIDYGSMQDNDGNIYPTRNVNNLQIWMCYNLRSTHYRNGDPIPELTNNQQWAGTSSGALCAPNNDWRLVNGYLR